MPLSTPWLATSLALYVMVGAFWLPVGWSQMRVARGAAMSMEQGQPLPEAHRRYMRWWYGLGWPAFVTVIGIFYLMVFKPALW